MSSQLDPDEDSSAYLLACARIDRLERELQRLQADAKRYQIVRQLSPAQFAELFNRALQATRTFDNLVDELA